MPHAPTNASRRDLLLLALSGAATAALPILGQAQDKAAAGPQLATLLDTFTEEILVLDPGMATARGLDTGKRSALKSRLPDQSPTGDARWAEQVKSMLTRLAAIDVGKLTPAERLHYESVRSAARAGMQGTRFAYASAADGIRGGTAPFPVTQQDGAVFQMPEFLHASHTIVNAGDAEAYLSRVAAMARVLDQETDRIAAQAAQGMAPSAAVARTALQQLHDFRKRPVSGQKLVTSITARTARLGIAGDWEARATGLVDKQIYPALDRQIATFEKATANATPVPGVHRLRDGEAYYAWALALGTTTTRSPAQVHATGLEQNRLLQSRMDAILKAQGMTQGTVGERMQALTRDPARLYADDDAGRAQLIAYCNDRLAAMRALMPKLSHLTLAAPLQIQRVPIDIESGAPLGYMMPAPLDGSRPAIYYINLKSTGLWPRSELSSLTAHEGIPGHTWQFAYKAEHQAELPLITTLLGMNAFTEGWALYAEQLVDEQGLYANDPFSQLGYLQGQQFRACRLVVDTGLHAMKWTREQAIAFLVDNAGRSPAAMASEIDRYSVSPGQACGYKTGHNEILLQRERARTALGARFDLAGFNDALVKTGGVPLTLLPEVIDQYVRQTKA